MSLEESAERAGKSLANRFANQDNEIIRLYEMIAGINKRLYVLECLINEKLPGLTDEDYRKARERFEKDVAKQQEWLSSLEKLKERKEE